MTITLEEFKQGIKSIARTNRFLVSITGNITSVITTTSDVFPFLVSKAQIPKKEITGPIMKYRGTSINLAGDFKHDSLILTFWGDSAWKARNYFETWMNLIVTNDEENDRQNLDVYRFGNSLTVSQIGNRETDILAEYQFTEVVPLELSEIELDQGSSDTLLEFTVTFHYSYWRRIGFAQLLF